MANEKYQVLTAPKTDGVSLKEAQEALATAYPAYSVEVFDTGNEYTAKLARKKTAAPPPFLDEDDDAKDDAPPADDGGEDKAPKPPKDDAPDDGGDDLDGAPPADDGGDKKDKGEGEGKGDDLSKALKALKELDHVLPKLKQQLETLNGGALPEGLGDGPLGPDGAPGGPGGLPGGPEGLGGPPGGPSQSDLDAVGPTPGKPTPGNAAPVIPGMGGAGPHPPHPGVGVPTFSNTKRNKFLYRPALNDDGTKISMAEAAKEISEHPRYAAYEVQDLKLDDNGVQYVAHLKLK